MVSKWVRLAGLVTCRKRYYSTILVCRNGKKAEILCHQEPLKVVNTASCVVKGNCRGTMKEKAETDEENQPLPKRRRKRK